MKLLLTNDDGIDSVFLHELVYALKDAGHTLFVAAPRREQSWIGCAKSRHRPVHATQVDRGFGCPTWSIDGTPSDCVNIAIAHLLKSPVDGVVSGINIGFNASIAFILASGTIGGAWEGAVHGLPAVAVSQDLNAAMFERLKEKGGEPDPDLKATLRHSAAYAARVIPAFIASTAPKSFIVHNLNFPYPCAPDTLMERTVPARVIIPGLFGPAADDGTHRFIFNAGEDISPEGMVTDRDAIQAGRVSHTVLDYSKLGL